MDPNQTLKEIQLDITSHTLNEFTDMACSDLWEWIRDGGFEPEWRAYPLGTEYYKEWKRQNA